MDPSEKSKGKAVAESAVEGHTYKIFPNDHNTNGTVFGGLIMSILDRLALVVAERHSEVHCVTASVDSMHFLAAATEGDVLIFKAAINRSWRTSMEIGVRVEAEDFNGKNPRHILSAYFTFVAMDESNKPCPVPAVLPKTPIEIRRYEEANLRRDERKRHAEEKARRRNS